jgi:hypothetical protein
MNEIDHIKKLAEAAQHEPPPRIDVTGPVLGAIARSGGMRGSSRRLGADASLNRTLCVFAVAALLMAAVTLGLAWQDWSSCLDPLQGIFGTLSMVMQ